MVQAGLLSVTTCLTDMVNAAFNDSTSAWKLERFDAFRQCMCETVRAEVNGACGAPSLLRADLEAALQAFGQRSLEVGLGEARAEAEFKFKVAFMLEADRIVGVLTGPVPQEPNDLTTERADYATRRAELEARLADLVEKKENMLGIEARLSQPPRSGSLTAGEASSQQSGGEARSP
jgi:hypothetical protein